MKAKTLVLFYSRTGNNRFAAHKFAEETGYDIEEVRPRVGGFLFLLLGSALKLGFGIRKLKRDIGSYDRIVLFAPIWMGQVVQPVRAFIRKYGKRVKSLAFVTVCGSDETSKATGFGYETVFGKIRVLLGEKFAGGFAVPVTLLGGPGANATETRLTESNFNGPIAARFAEIAAALAR